MKIKLILLILSILHCQIDGFVFPGWFAKPKKPIEAISTVNSVNLTNDSTVTPTLQGLITNTTDAPSEKFNASLQTNHNSSKIEKSVEISLDSNVSVAVQRKHVKISPDIQEKVEPSLMPSIIPLYERTTTNYNPNSLLYTVASNMWTLPSKEGIRYHKSSEETRTNQLTLHQSDSGTSTIANDFTAGTSKISIESSYTKSPSEPMRLFSTNKITMSDFTDEKVINDTLTDGNTKSFVTEEMVKHPLTESITYNNKMSSKVENIQMQTTQAMEPLLEISTEKNKSELITKENQMENLQDPKLRGFTTVKSDKYTKITISNEFQTVNVGKQKDDNLINDKTIKETTLEKPNQLNKSTFIDLSTVSPSKMVKDNYTQSTFKGNTDLNKELFTTKEVAAKIQSEASINIIDEDYTTEKMIKKSSLNMKTDEKPVTTSFLEISFKTTESQLSMEKFGKVTSIETLSAVDNNNTKRANSGKQLSKNTEETKDIFRATSSTIFVKTPFKSTEEIEKTSTTTKITDEITKRNTSQNVPSEKSNPIDTLIMARSLSNHNDKLRDSIKITTTNSSNLKNTQTSSNKPSSFVSTFKVTESIRKLKKISTLLPVPAHIIDKLSTVASIKSTQSSSTIDKKPKPSLVDNRELTSNFQSRILTKKIFDHFPTKERMTPRWQTSTQKITTTTGKETKISRSKVNWIIRDSSKLDHLFHPVCTLDVDEGRGSVRYSSWFYNQTSRRCEWFHYRGDEGNGNRFNYRGNCENYCIGNQEDICIRSDIVFCEQRWLQCRMEFDQYCQRKAEQNNKIAPLFCPPPQPVCATRTGRLRKPPLYLTHRSMIPTECHQRKDPGLCYRNSNSVLMFHYDQRYNDCFGFLYSKCGGNSNRFATRDECMNHCAF